MKKQRNKTHTNKIKNKKYKISVAYKGLVAAGIAAAVVFSSATSYMAVPSAAAQASGVAATVNMRTDTVASQIGTRRAAPQRGAAGVVVNGEIPMANLTGPGSAALNTELNARFLSQRDNFIQAHRARTPEMEFSTRVFSFNEYVSVVVRMYAIGANTTRSVETTVINTQTMQIVNIKDINPNMLSIINNRINNDIATNPRLFIAGFEGIFADHPFYINDGSLHVLFAAGSIHSGHRQISTYTFNLSAIQNEVIDSSMFFVALDDGYNTQMVNLAVAEIFGYTVYRTQNDVTLVREDAEASFTISQNSFTVNGVTRVLEAAAVIRDGDVYAPLSFFSQMLSISTTILNEDELFMSEWRGYDGISTTIGAMQSIMR